MRGRIVILSDTHLGRPTSAARSCDALRPLWRDAEHLIINGDVAEVHHPVHNISAAREALRLHDLCDIDGVQLTLLSGNHDPYITDLRHLTLRDGRIFVTHGDVLHPAVAPWSPAAGRMRETHEAALASLYAEDRAALESHLWASQRAASAEWDEIEKEAARSTILGMLLRPWSIAQVFLYWRVIPDLAAKFASTHSPDAGFVIFGHTHRAGIWKRRGLTVINTGCYGFPGRPRAVTIENDVMSVWPIVDDGEHYAFGKKPLQTWTLPAVAEKPVEEAVAV